MTFTDFAIIVGSGLVIGHIVGYIMACMATNGICEILKRIQNERNNNDVR